MDLSELQLRIDELAPWHYAHLLDGLPTGEIEGNEKPHDKMVQLLNAGAFSRKIYPRVLDLGANSGIISQWFVDNRGSKVDAVEFHPKYFAQLELVVEVKGYQDRIKPINKDIHDGDFGHNQYDLIIFLGVLHHLVNDMDLRIKILGDCVKALIPGGEIVIQTESKLPVAEMMRDVGLLGVEKLGTKWNDRAAWFGFKDPMKLWT